MICLLCGNILKEALSFSSLLLLKKAESLACQGCFSFFERIGEDHCPSCFKNGVSSRCQDCQFWSKEGIEVEHRALFIYNQAMKDFFSRYKFEGDFLLRKVFTKILLQELKRYKGYQFVLIPLSPKRLSDRGFNQVEGLIKETGLPYLDILEKREEKASFSKSRSDRLETELPFFVKRGIEVPKKVLLIDDIYTTGTTLNRVKSLIEAAGCQKVKTFSIVR